MEKKETRGRPATGRKQYKNITVRLEENKYKEYEQIAQEKAGVSIHTFTKDHINKIFESEDAALTIPQRMLDFLKEIEDKEEQRKTLQEANRKITKFLEEYIFQKTIKLFKEEYTYHNFKNITEENSKLLSEILEICDIYAISLKFGTNRLTLNFLEEEAAKKIEYFLKIYPSHNEALQKYFVEKFHKK